MLDGPHLVAFSDASHAPLKSTGRRGISGGVISYGGALIKTLSRHQTVSLSSMEAELFALQAVAQELSSMGKIVARILGSFKEIDAGQTIPGVLYSDSESALKLLRNLDLPRKSVISRSESHGSKKGLNESILCWNSRKE